FVSEYGSTAAYVLRLARPWFGSERTIVGDIAIVNDIYLIAASLKDRKPQCIIATASTTTQSDEVERIVKDHNNSSLVKFTRPKIFSEYSSSK
ncbi:19977_t:CDS:2, partial [Racocetra fulgida]